MQRRVFLSFILFILRLRVFSRTGNRPDSHGNVRLSVAVPERSHSKPEAHGLWVNNPRHSDQTGSDDWYLAVW